MEHLQHLRSLPSGPEVLGFRGRRVAVQWMAGIVGLAGGKLGDGLGQSCVSGLLIDAGLAVGAQIVSERGVEDAHVLLRRARGASDD
jgi:hypothetical protein